MPEILVRAPRTEAEWSAYFDVRWRVLRAPWGQPRGSERDEFEDAGYHRLALLDGARPVGVGRLHRVDDTTGQIRFMAVESAFERRGVGTRILAALEEAAHGAGLHSIRLHAREGAAAFYLHHGYRDLGASHLLFGEIRHRLMEKRI